ncbi:MAG: AFG1 family ATPase [Phyllobacteriaceae bacterium]|nr:AFG1 family ATPase [Phyllobacteriaceae bacterium]
MSEIDRAESHADTDNAITRRYEALARAGDITPDTHQRAVVRRLDRLSEAVTRRQLARKSSALGWLFARGKPVSAIRGVYLSGAVGRGKTMLLDLFFNAAQTPQKRRVHFNAFMADIHDRIGRHRALARSGKPVGDDPIPPVAKAVAAESWLLCFDEFSVTDIADAMILSRLFTALFAEGVVLVATSNVPPDDLYKDGLNRSLFTPFLAVLARHVDAVSLDGPVDYRLTRGRLDPHWLTPADRDADAAMDVAWAELGPESAGELKVKGRTVVLPRLAGRAARFTFAELCEQPHGARDYLALAGRIDTLFLDHVPVMDNTLRNAAKRFILLVDTLYDRRIALRASAAAEPDGLCRLTSGTEKFEFARTASRLNEMRSEGWDKAVGDASGR